MDILSRMLQAQESVDDLSSLLDQFRDEIANAFEGMSKKEQESEKGEKLDAIMDYLQAAKNGLDTAYNEIQSILSLS